MPDPMSIIIIGCDRKDALICADQLYREAVSASTAKAPTPATEKKTSKASAADKTPGSSKGSCNYSGKHTSSECCVPAKDVPESSTGKSKKSKAALPETKKESMLAAFPRVNVDVFACGPIHRWVHCVLAGCGAKGCRWLFLGESPLGTTAALASVHSRHALTPPRRHTPFLLLLLLLAATLPPSSYLLTIACHKRLPPHHGPAIGSSSDGGADGSLSVWAAAARLVNEPAPPCPPHHPSLLGLMGGSRGTSQAAAASSAQQDEHKKLAAMFGSYGRRLEARALNDLILYGRQYTLLITTSRVFSEGSWAIMMIYLIL
ncbi:uncharacterized protein [Triticum aestivum]|uniref:uncharacterized protein n=1 Tax=Triticum aestivum TaxID=4565 RepID=UPI001D031870|nr:uncharacterized protein LOC123139275 [Triticum aestivum]